jgi:hypothetical protein
MRESIGRESIMRFRVLAMLAALLCSVALPLGAWGQARERERGNIALTGDIKAVDVDERTLTIADIDGEEVTYQVDDSATIMKGATNLELGDLEKGWNVTVSGHELRDTKTLTFIKVMKAP